MAKLDPLRKYKAEALGQVEYFYTPGAAIYWAEMVQGIDDARRIRGAK